MHSSTMFIRGQVWYWEDPMFGRKETKSQVTIGEATIRYNRYCIIAQTTETISNNTVLVIPCSSTNNTPHDVKVPLAHTFRENFTYAKTRSMFPVHPKFLNRYICTLPSEVMNQIDAELIKLLFPAITANMDNDHIRSTLGIDMTLSPEVKIESRDIGVLIRSFMKEHIERADESSIVFPRELKDAFDQYCVINQIPVIEDIVEFLDSFTYIVNGCSYNLTDRFNYNSMEFKGIKIKDNFKLSIDVNTDEVLEPELQKPRRWTDESVMEFLKFYHDHDIMEVYEKFNIRPNTARSYWAKWKDRLPVIEEVATIPLPTTAEANLSVSKVANMIRDDLKAGDIFTCLNEIKTSRGDSMNPEEFYDRLGSTIYFSLIDFLGIVQHDWKNFYIPKIHPKSKNIKSWHFFDKVYHDKRVSGEKSGQEMVKKYVEHYGDINTGIDREWIDKLKSKLSNKFMIDDDCINFICECISEVYCN